jgi:hypothetical protein
MGLLVLFATVAQVFFTMRGLNLSRGSGDLWYFTFSYVIALLVEVDRKTRQVPAPFEYAAFVLFVWPLAVPYYLFKTRGWRGFAIGLGLILLAAIPDFAALVTYNLVGD